MERQMNGKCQADQLFSLSPNNSCTKLKAGFYVCVYVAKVTLHSNLSVFAASKTFKGRNYDYCQKLAQHWYSIAEYIFIFYVVRWCTTVKLRAVFLPLNPPTTYLSEVWPLPALPASKPTKNREVDIGTFHALSHTRSHYETKQQWWNCHWLCHRLNWHNWLCDCCLFSPYIILSPQTPLNTSTQVNQHMHSKCVEKCVSSE